MFLSRLLDPSLPPPSLFYFCLFYGSEMYTGGKPAHLLGMMFTSGLKVEAMVSMVSGDQTPAGVWLALRVGCFAREESKRQMGGAEPLHGSPPRAAGMSLAVALVNALAKTGVCSPFQNKLCLASHCQHKTRAYLLC